MKISSVFTRRRMGLDNNVWLVMLILVIICSGLLAYKVVDNNKIKPCLSINVMVNGLASSQNKIYNAGEYLLFKAGSSVQANEVTWNFGDDSPTENGYTTSHVFKGAGTFAVTTTVNENCVTTTNITIAKPVVAQVDSAGKIVETITGKDAVKSGITELYSTSLKANSYMWSILNNSFYKSVQGKQASFKFKSAGIYTISLVLDNDRSKSYTKEIFVSDPTPEVSGGEDFQKPGKLIPDYPVVIPKKDEPVSNQNQQAQTQTVPNQPQAQPQVQPPPEEAPRKIAITDNQLKKMLSQVIINKMHAPEFDKYFCSEGNTKVYINDEKLPVNFSDFCSKYLLGKKVEIESAHIVKDPDNPACESNLVVRYKKGGLFNKIF